MSGDASKQERGSAVRALAISSKFSRRAERLQKWDAFKNEVYRLYIIEDNTLQVTMSTIEEQYSFKASLRKWKLKLKEWGFEKYLSRSDMAVIAAKANKRYREERKETVFYHGETRISKERLDNFKRRKISEHDYVLCDADTPPHISYSTPEPEICDADTPPHISDSIAEPDMSVILRSKRCELVPFAPPYNTRVKPMFLDKQISRTRSMPPIRYDLQEEHHKENVSNCASVQALSTYIQYSPHLASTHFIVECGKSAFIFQISCSDLIEWLSITESQEQNGQVPATPVQDLAKSYPILDILRDPAHAHLIGLFGNAACLVRIPGSALAEYLVSIAKSHEQNEKVSAALITYFLAITICLRAMKVAKEVLLEYITEFLDLQERDCFLPGHLDDVLCSYRQLMADILRVYGPSAPIVRMAAMTARFQEQSYLVNRLKRQLFPGLPDLQSERWQNVLFTTINYSLTLVLQYGSFVESLAHIMLDSETCLKHWQKRTPEGHEPEVHYDIPISIYIIMESVRLVQNNIRFWTTEDKRKAYVQLAERFCELAVVLSAHGLLQLATPLFLYMVSNMERIIFCRSNPRQSTSGRAIEARTVIDEIMRLERKELQLALPNLFETIENKVQEWLGLEVASLEVPNSSLPGRSEIRRSDNQESVMEGTPSVMETSVDEEENLDMMEVQTSVMISLDEQDRQGALSVMEVDDEEMDECPSITTDLRSSKYGITYTESEISGISYNYTALFPV